MNIKNLQFFGKDGYNLNLEWNTRNNYWEGTIYLPKVSVGLYTNTSIYILEQIGDSFYFPKASSTGDKILFTWDFQNKFVDEFFMFTFDNTYVSKDTSSLEYIPNDGPECETLIINRFDEYEIPLESTNLNKALPVHIAFMASERYDATTYNRTLIMSYNDETIARIKFHTETVEEDERLKIWNSNLGYNITPDDTLIFYKSDINECRPDYQLLNEKRKELMMEGSNIYPYIGSYKAIINAIKFFGYDNLGIIEYWKNVNVNDENFGKIYHTSRYSLTKKETLNVGARTITLPNADYKKVNKIALVYSINTPTTVVDDWELPLVKEEFTYTIEEALIKLFALRKKLNNEFMPGSSRIYDVIGEASYFGIQGIKKIGSSKCSVRFPKNSETEISFDLYPGKYVYLTDDRYFNTYMKELDDNGKGYDCTDTDEDKEYSQNISVHYKISDVGDWTIGSDLDEGERINLKYILGDSDSDDQIQISIPNTEGIYDYYKDYYDAVYVNHTRYEEDIYDDLDDVYAPISAKVLLYHNLGDLSAYGFTDGSDSDEKITVTWIIERSLDQYDDDLKNAGIEKNYYRGTYSIADGIKPTKDELTVSTSPDYEEPKVLSGNKVLVTLKHTGYYDVTLDIEGVKKTVKKCIKVEPYDVEIKGFYYDARNLPENLDYEISDDSDMYKYILEKLNSLIGWATSEKTKTGETSNWNNEDIDQSMPIYSGTDNSLINTGPYREDNTQSSWYLLDNVAYGMSLLKPYVEYARYIRNGVDVKPYTWFLLTYNYSKLSGIGYDPDNNIFPIWTLTNTTTGEKITYKGRYLTCLLKDEGDYNITLSVVDTNDNKYEVSRNIIVVSKTANYDIYQRFKEEYDDMVEQEDLALSKELQEYNLS